MSNRREVSGIERLMSEYSRKLKSNLIYGVSKEKIALVFGVCIFVMSCVYIAGVVLLSYQWYKSDSRWAEDERNQTMQKVWVTVLTSVVVATYVYYVLKVFKLERLYRFKSEVESLLQMTKALVVSK